MSVDWDSETLHGIWWDPGEPSKMVGGRITREGRYLRLILLGTFGDEPDRPGPRHSSYVPSTVHGRVQGQPLTLFGCWDGGHSSSLEGTYESTIIPTYGLGGVHISDPSDASFTEVTVRLEHADVWAGRRPFASTDRENDDRTVGMAFTDPGVVQATVSGAEITMGRSLNWTHGATTVRMDSHEVIRLVLREPSDVDQIEGDYIQPLANLLSLATRHPCRVLSLEVRINSLPAATGCVGSDRDDQDESVDGDDDLSFPRYATVIRSRPAFEQEEEVWPHELLFSMDTLGFERTITRWFEMDASLRTVCDLVNSMWTERGYLTTGFLNGATALEGYHRCVSGKEKETSEQRARRNKIVALAPHEDRDWLDGNLRYAYQMDYADRVDTLIDRVGHRFESVIGNRAEWIRWVKAGRNSLAHRDPKMVDLEDEAVATIRITASISWLLVYLLLQDLGLSDVDLDKAVHNSWAWKAVRPQLEAAVPSLFGPTI